MTSWPFHPSSQEGQTQSRANLNTLLHDLRLQTRDEGMVGFVELLDEAVKGNGQGLPSL